MAPTMAQPVRQGLAVCRQISRFVALNGFLSIGQIGASSTNMAYCGMLSPRITSSNDWRARTRCGLPSRSNTSAAIGLEL